MNESASNPRVTGSGIFAAIVTAMVTGLAANILLRVLSGAWTPGPNETFVSILAVESLDLAIVVGSMLLVSTVILVPIFLATAALGLWRVPHAINAGLVGGAVLLVIAVTLNPNSAVEHLLPMAFVQFSTAIAASLAFRSVSVRNHNV